MEILIPLAVILLAIASTINSVLSMKATRQLTNLHARLRSIEDRGVDKGRKVLHEAADVSSSNSVSGMDHRIFFRDSSGQRVAALTPEGKVLPKP